jgi:VWD domain-containing protein
MTKQTSKYLALRCGVPGYILNGTLNPAREKGRLLRLATLILMVASMGAGYASAQPQPKPRPKPNLVEGPNLTVKPSPLLLRQREAWRKSMVRSPRPKKGCFVATYPQTTWKEVPCVTPALIPFGPHRGARPFSVGNGTDFAAQVTANTTQAEGSFENVTNAGGMTESGGGIADKYSLQINTNTFSTTTCSGAANPATCKGWEQFIYSSKTLGEILIQYWLLGYNNPCPAGWGSDGGGDCFRNNAGAATVPVQVINAASLGQMTLYGDTTDQVTLTSGGTVWSAPGDNYFPDLANGWRITEFNIFGDASATPSADFNPGSSMDVRTRVNSGMGATPPTCDANSGFTFERNNLNLVSAPAMISDVNWPSIVFTQDNITGTTASCDNADAAGDTHLKTFAGLYYDFQASGDFVLAEDGPDFLVQARQASGAPNWPNAAVNKGVAVRLGNTRAAFYVEPDRLLIDGRPENLADGKDLQFPGGVQLIRNGNQYLFSSANGNQVRVVLNGAYIDAHVGLGHVGQPRGLLGNPQRNINQLVTSRGVVLNEPVAFVDLYHGYADSWRVQANQSLFTEATTIKAGIPSSPFFANHLKPQEFARARAVCAANHITNKTLLDACTLDTAVLNTERAAKVFIQIRPPLHVIKPVLRESALREPVHPTP